MFLSRINKNYPELSPNTPSYLELCMIRQHSLVLQCRNEDADEMANSVEPDQSGLDLHCLHSQTCLSQFTDSSNFTFNCHYVILLLFFKARIYFKPTCTNVQEALLH